MKTLLETTLKNLHEKNPLVLNLTNVVTMDFMANALLAIGASPLMSLAEEELEELITIASAVNINIGTLDNTFNQRILKAAQLAKTLNKPVILDPVGAGASKLRTDTAKALLPYCNIIRGNASEILSLANITHQTKGVDSTHNTTDAKHAAQTLANTYACIVVVSGAIDYLTDGTQDINLPYGSPLMPRVVGMGCTLTAVIAAFAGAHQPLFNAAHAATLYFGLCGNAAEKMANAPASFQQAFIDTLYQADIETLVPTC